MADVIHVAFCCDRRQVRFLASALASVIANAGPEHICFYVIDVDLAHKDKAVLREIVGNGRFSLRYLPVTDHMAGSFPERRCGRGTYPNAAFYRLFLPELLPDVEVALYLDVDVIVFTSLLPLCGDYALNGYALAAVEDSQAPNVNRRLGLPDENPYFNSGVLVLHLAKWREQGLQKKMLHCVREGWDAWICADQDALNVIFHNAYCRLDDIWNKKAKLYEEGYLCNILHFMGTEKLYIKASLYLHRYVATTRYRLFSRAYYSLTNSMPPVLSKHIMKYVSTAPLDALTLAEYANALVSVCVDSVRSLADVFSGRPVYFWGAGYAYAFYKEMVSRCLPVCMLADREFAADMPERIDGIPVRAPEQILLAENVLPVLIFTRARWAPFFRKKLREDYPHYEKHAFFCIVPE